MKNLFAIAAVAAMLVACSSNNTNNCTSEGEKCCQAADTVAAAADTTAAPADSIAAPADSAVVAE